MAEVGGTGTTDPPSSPPASATGTERDTEESVTQQQPVQGVEEVEEAEDVANSMEQVEDPGGGNKDEEEEEESSDEDEGLTGEQLLLLHSRNGNVKKVTSLLEKHLTAGDGAESLNVNCKGQHKSNMGWSPIHLASYFGHIAVVEVLLEHGADVNAVNDAGDTALHRAAYTGRENVVTLLLKKDADVSLINSEGNTAKMVARTSDIRSLIEAAETYEMKRSKDSFLKAAANGDTSTLTNVLKSRSRMNINSTDQYGNTALHLAAVRGRKEAAVMLLQNGIDSTLRNAKGQLALDLCTSQQMKQILDVKPIRELRKDVQRFEGPLAKKTRILGWRPFWVVLERGVLSLYKTKLDGATGIKRKFSKHLERAKLETKSGTGHIFFVRFSDNSILYLAVAPDEEANVNRQRWENALKAHIEFSTSLHEGSSVSDDDDDVEDLLPLGSMQDALETAGAHQKVLEKEVKAVHDIVQGMSERTTTVQLLQARQRMGTVVEDSQDMFTALSHCFTVFTQQEQIRQQSLASEQEKGRVLQESLKVLAAQYHHLQTSVDRRRQRHNRPSSRLSNMADSPQISDADQTANNNNSEDEASSGSSSDGVDEFYECTADEVVSSFKEAAAQMESIKDFNNSNGESESVYQSTTAESNRLEEEGELTISEWGGRCRLPVPMISRNDFSVWSILKQCIGKELSKITMPVVFNEPLSFLQRVVEYMEYGSLLNKAASCDDPIQRMEYVAAFAVSSSASNWDRVGKPFNPMLGETYELDREDLGFRVMCEQVSHHPPVSAFHVESPEYTFQGAIHPKLKFWGKSVEVTPKGIVTLHLLKYDESYSWQMVNCCVHNIIVGTLWIEHYGNMEIVNNKTRHKAVLNFKPSGWFSKDLHKVEGYIYDGSKKKVKALYGKWIDAMFSVDVPIWENHLQSASSSSSNVSKKSSDTDEANNSKGGDGVPTVTLSSCNLHLPGQMQLWQAEPKPSETNKYYSFTLFAMMLNEIRTDMDMSLPPTDSRLRPDIRKLEEGDLDGAAAEKHRLEEKQRAARKERKKSKEEWMPLYFSNSANPQTGKDDWLYNGRYWSKDWSCCEDIF